MAGIALMFAIHSYRPSPFFVLDEVRRRRLRGSSLVYTVHVHFDNAVCWMKHALAHRRDRSRCTCIAEEF